MFNFFNKNANSDSGKPTEASPEWLALLKENESRYEVFLSKLEAKAVELTQEALPELQHLKQEDERQYGLMLSGILGQLENIRSKAHEVFNEKIDNIYQSLKNEVEVFSPFYQKITDFRTVSSNRLNNDFDEKLRELREQLQSTNYTDYEVIYQQILDEHEQIKDKFKCQQCGDTIPLTKIYFITTHLTCPSCQNKNTFIPSTLAKGLEHIGRSLAEQRTEPLLQKKYAEEARERDLYLKAHQLRLKQSFDKKDLELERQIEDLETARKQSQSLIPQYYQEYERAMFDEWKRLVPDLAEQIEKFYEGQQKRKY